jgi:hypothetical protein
METPLISEYEQELLTKKEKYRTVAKANLLADLRGLLTGENGGCWPLIKKAISNIEQERYQEAEDNLMGLARLGVEWRRIISKMLERFDLIF